MNMPLEEKNRGLRCGIQCKNSTTTKKKTMEVNNTYTIFLYFIFTEYTVGVSLFGG